MHEILVEKIEEGFKSKILEIKSREETLEREFREATVVIGESTEKIQEILLKTDRLVATCTDSIVATNTQEFRAINQSLENFTEHSHHTLKDSMVTNNTLNKFKDELSYLRDDIHNISVIVSQTNKSKNRSS